MSAHRHILIRHRHPDWLGHSDPSKRGYKREDRWHWHFWWKHDHSPTAPVSSASGVSS